MMMPCGNKRWIALNHLDIQLLQNRLTDVTVHQTIIWHGIFSVKSLSNWNSEKVWKTLIGKHLHHSQNLFLTRVNFLTESKNMVRYCGPITGRWVGGPIDHNSKVVIIGSNFESKVFIQSGTFYFLTGCFKIKRNIMAFTNTTSSYNDDYDYILVIMNSKWCIIVVY